MSKQVWHRASTAAMLAATAAAWAGAARAQAGQAPPVLPPAAASPPTSPPVDTPYAERNDVPLTVLERQARRERQRGVHVGAVHIQPVASLRLDYNSNVFAAPTAEGDAVVTLAGRVVADFDTRHHAGTISAEVSRAQYARLTSENATQWRVGAADTVKLPYNIEVAANASYAAQVEPRTSSGAPVEAGRPVRYDVAQGDIQLTWHGGRFLVAVGGNAALYDYKNTVLPDGGGTLDQQFRDYRYYQVRGRIAYDLGGPQLFLAADRHWVRYRIRPSSGLDRDTQGWEATIGLSSEITPLLRGSLSIGYLYDSFALVTTDPVSTVAFGASLDWLVTPITTVGLTASRRLENGTSIDADGYLSSRVGLRVDHELTRSILLDLGLGYENAAFRTIDRDDHIYSVSGGARLQLIGGLSVALREAYQRRRSTGLARGFDFDQSVTSGSVNYRY